MVNGLKSFLKGRLRGTRLLQWYYELYPERPLHRDSLRQAVLLSRWVMYARLRWRTAWFLLRRGFKVEHLDLRPAEAGDAHLAKVVDHNFRQDLSLKFCRRRSEHLVTLLRSVPSVRRSGKVLSIGPKNEGELLVFRAHGFADVRGIDLFSCSPLIRVMDMHRMDFPDDTFDVVCAAWVLRYSYDIRRCVDEIVRVAKDGAHIAVAFSAYPEETNKSPGLGAPLYGGIEELLGYFKPAVRHVYWNMEDGNTDESDVPLHTHSVVFSLSKPGAGRP